MRVSFVVFGKQVTQGSKTVVPVGGGRYRAVDSKAHELRHWRGQIVQSAGKAMKGMGLMDGPVCLRIVFSFPRPKGHFGTGRNAGKLRPSAPKYPAKKPDLSKLVRAVEDALSGVVYRDDAQVCKQVVSKCYGKRYETRIVVTDELD